MPPGTQFDPDLPIDVIMRCWPQTITVLIGHDMQCVGCVLAPFHNARDAAFEHEIDENALLVDMARVVAERST